MTATRQHVEYQVMPHTETHYLPLICGLNTSLLMSLLTDKHHAPETHPSLTISYVNIK